ncbi:F-box/kelch-repeat protein At3g06240-like [Malania oleifera]|uniref:F-box/kelch-repeat protein At3g06240-like n=1 Tax=Malania oleifera TaxID=397392 RepID=UPI0025AE387C|nr:F-box/kelch-repeat protein At3g06240-like [Malania oleifera]
MKRSSEFTEAIPYVPTDIVAEILLRLPPKAIGRLRCVCKAWAALVSSPYFITTHLNCSTSNKKNQQILCSLPFRNPRHRQAIYILRRGGDPTPLLTDFPPSVHFESDPECPVHVSSHHGLVCLWTHTQAHLWNPSTGETRALPAVHHRPSHRLRYVWGGLGSHRLSDGTEDYKVVRVLRFKSGESGEQEIKGEVYSLRGDDWKDVAFNSKTKLIRSCDREVAAVNQTMNWVGLLMPFGCAVVSFDVAAESFRFVEFTEDCLYLPKIGVWEGSVCVLIATAVGGWEVWVMGERTAAAAWRKVLGFTAEGDLAGAVPMGLTLGGEVVMLKEGKGRTGRVMVKDGGGEKGVVVNVVEEFVLPKDAYGVHMHVLFGHLETLVSVNSAPGCTSCVGSDILQQQGITDLSKWNCLWGFFFRILLYFSF